MKLQTGLKCLKCEDIIVSKHRHDFRWCKCGSVAIDGGDSYTKVCGNPSDYILITVNLTTGKEYKGKK